MQWSADEHAGFAPPGTEELVRPLCDDYGQVNVADQRRDKDSLLKLDGAAHDLAPRGSQRRR